MYATGLLIEEHEVVVRVLNAMEKAAKRLEAGESVKPDFFIRSAEFIKGFADGCHHKKEEGVLFPAMVEAGLPKESGPVAVMLAEHEEGRQLTRAMRQAAEKMHGSDSSTKDEVIMNALSYVRLLRMHIQKENNILFPMADKIIPVGEQRQITEAFERIEHEETGEGVHEKYLGLAEQLEKESLQ